MAIARRRPRHATGLRPVIRQDYGFAVPRLYQLNTAYHGSRVVSTDRRADSNNFRLLEPSIERERTAPGDEEKE